MTCHSLAGFSNAHSSISQIKQNMNTDGFKFVTFVRNPYDRFKSMYNFLLIKGMMHDTPVTFALNLFQKKYQWNFTHPMSFFCKMKDLDDVGRVETFEKDFQRIFNKPFEIPAKNKTERADIYTQFPQLRDMVARLYYEDFIEFKYEIDTIIYKEIPVQWKESDLEPPRTVEYIQSEYVQTGSIFDRIPLTKMVTR